MSKNSIWSFIISIEVVIYYEINAQHNWNQHTSKHEPSENVDLNWKVRKICRMSKTCTQVKMNSCATIRTQVQRTNTEWSQKLVKNSSSKHKHEMKLKLLNCVLHSYCAMGSHNIEDEIQMHSLRIKPPNKKMLVALIALKLSLSMVLSPDNSFVLNSELLDILKLSKVQWKLILNIDLEYQIEFIAHDLETPNLVVKGPQQIWFHILNFG